MVELPRRAVHGARPGARHRVLPARPGLTWRDKLPPTVARTAAEVTGPVEAALLPEAHRLSVHRLRDRATELVLAPDAAAADERRTEAERTADVRLYPSPTDGRATLAADLPTEEAVECFDVVDQLARMLETDGDDRPIGALRAHVLSLLVRRPADNWLPQVCADVTITADLSALAGTSSAPGEVGGCRSPPPTSANCSPGSARSASPPPSAAAAPTPAQHAAARSPGRHRQLSTTGRRTGSGPSSPPATGGAGSPAADNASAGPISTTSPPIHGARARTAHARGRPGRRPLGLLD
ncbi:MAG: endonuclease [Modestobacter sp.]|nr:endonuclease [Modestobacter sp.]